MFTLAFRNRQQSTTTAALCMMKHHQSIPFGCRGIKTLDFGGTKEVVYERADYPPSKLQALFGQDKLAVIGYGVQGRAQSLNMRDNGLHPIIGVRPGGPSWKLAESDGWVAGKTLFPIEEACQQSSTVMYLLSDAGQKENWSTVSKHLTRGKTLYFSHGFSVIFSKDTGVIPPKVCAFTRLVFVPIQLWTQHHE